MKPNIIFLLLDAARASNFSCYGYPEETTPFLDSIADEGVRYENAFANSIYSLPSYGSIFTGNYPTEHGAVDWSKRLGTNRLVQQLNSRDYDTRAISTHLVASGEFGISGEFRSTDAHLAGSTSIWFEPDPVHKKVQGINQLDVDDDESIYYEYLRQLAQNPNLNSVLNVPPLLISQIKKKFGYWEDDGAAEALQTAGKEIASASEPFFTFINFVETHEPYRPPRSYIRKFLPEDVSLEEVKEALAYTSAEACLNVEQISNRQQEILMALYNAELRYLDDQIRDFYTDLESRGLMENTVFVVISDHGDYFGEHDLWGHQGRVYNEVCHVPLIIKYPWETGEVVEEPVQLCRLCPHLLSLADGQQERLEPNGYALVEYYGIDTQLSYTPSEKFDSVASEEWEVYECALIKDPYKFIWNANGEIELYNIDTDFGETNDLSDQEPRIVDEYKRRIESLVGRPEENHRNYRKGGTGSMDEMDKDVRDRLSELGYVE